MIPTPTLAQSQSQICFLHYERSLVLKDLKRYAADRAELAAQFPDELLHYGEPLGYVRDIEMYSMAFTPSNETKSLSYQNRVSGGRSCMGRDNAAHSAYVALHVTIRQSSAFGEPLCRRALDKHRALGRIQIAFHAAILDTNTIRMFPKATDQVCNSGGSRKDAPSCFFALDLRSRMQSLQSSSVQPASLKVRNCFLGCRVE